MADTLTAEASSESYTGTFPPMYYDSPVDQVVLSFQLTGASSLGEILTASITAGQTYFKVSRVQVTTSIYVPPPPGGGKPQVVVHPAAPPVGDVIASSDGTKPSTVEVNTCRPLGHGAGAQGFPPDGRGEVHRHGRAERQVRELAGGADRDLSRQPHGENHFAAGDGGPRPARPGPGLRRRASRSPTRTSRSASRVSRSVRSTTSSPPPATAIS